MNSASKHQEFEELRAKVADIEHQVGNLATQPSWSPKTYFWIYHAFAGMLLGLAGGAAALLVNVMMAPMLGKHPLELIRVFLTFPLGAQALALTETPSGGAVVRDGMILTFGCGLYLVTGMLLGIPTHTAIARLAPGGTLSNRLIVGSGAALAIWLVGFYGVLSWLQPLWFGGNWITSGEHLPMWVAAATHGIFGVTMALLDPLAKLIPTPAPEPWDVIAAASAEEPPIGPGG
jgi:hypothetical protein